MHKCFVGMFVSVPYVCSVFTDTRREHQVPWNLSYGGVHSGIWPPLKWIKIIVHRHGHRPIWSRLPYKTLDYFKLTADVNLGILLLLNWAHNSITLDNYFLFILLQISCCYHTLSIEQLKDFQSFKSFKETIQHLFKRS